MKRNWIKLWVDQCLRGSLIEELTPIQRWLWIGLLLMAGDSNIPGLIYRRLDENHEPIGFSDVTISELLDIPLPELQAGLKRLVETEKLSVNEKGVITIRNWKKYQSEYSRQEPYRNRKACNESYKESCNQSYKDNCNESYMTESDIDIDIEREEDIYTRGESERGNNKSNSKKEEINSVKVESTSKNAEYDSKNLIGDIIAKWNSFAQEHGLARVGFIKPGTTRYQKLKARLKEKEFDFDAILKEIERSDFLKGASSNWRVSFDWIICPNNYPKVLEGQYRSKFYNSQEELEAWAKEENNDKQK